MEQLLHIINELSSTSSRNDKEAILKTYKNDSLFKEILKFVYDSFIVTGLSDKKIKKKVKLNPTVPLHTIQDAMNYLKINNTGRDIDIVNIQNFISNFEKPLQDLYSQIVTKSLKTGITSTTINKIYGENFINTFDVMLAEKYFECEDKVNGDFIITEKLDGIRCVILKENDNIKMFTRQGQVIEGLVEIEEETKLLPDNMVYDGELILVNKNNLNSADLYRETVKVVRKDGVKHNIVFHVFDMLTIDEFKKGISHVPCIQRKTDLHDNIDGKFKFIKEVSMMYVGKDKEVILPMLNKVILEGKEGLMLNIANGKYECKRSKAILKIKKFSDADVRVIDLIEGTGQNVGKLGAITIQFEHEGKIHECNCGSGFSQDERVLYWNNPELIKDKIVTIGYFEVSKNQNGGYGLRFPTWKSIIRHDKNEISMY